MSNFKFKQSESTSKEYCKLIDVDYLDDADISRNNNGDVVYIELPVYIDGYGRLNTKYLSPLPPIYRFTLCKESSEDGAWVYNLNLELPEPIIVNYSIPELKERFPIGRTYCWGDMWTDAATKFILVSEKKGYLKNFFEETLDEIWTNDDLVIECSFNDSNFNIWMEKLEKATINGLMEWTKISDNSYCSNFDEIDVELCVNLNLERGDSELLYIRNNNGGTGTRFGHSSNLVEVGGDDEVVGKISKYVTNHRILSLAKKIEADIKYKNNSSMCETLVSKYIVFTDVLVVTQSMICHNQHHIVTPLKGIIELLTSENTVVNYEIYVGYCKSCNRYYVFHNSYIEMLKFGTPLCNVYNNKHEHQNAQNVPFRYKSQSVLHSMGYTVGLINNLSSKERQEILLKALNRNLFDSYDLLNFLNWLVRTREPQTKYKEAVSKWREDIKFVEDYQKDNRQSVYVNSITLK